MRKNLGIWGPFSNLERRKHWRLIHLDCGPGAVLGAGHVAVNKTRPNGRGGSKGRQTIRQYLVNKYTNK